MYPGNEPVAVTMEEKGAVLVVTYDGEEVYT